MKTKENVTVPKGIRHGQNLKIFEKVIPSLLEYPILNFFRVTQMTKEKMLEN